MKTFIVNLRKENDLLSCWDSSDPVEAFETACEYLSEDDFSLDTFSALRDFALSCNVMQKDEPRRELTVNGVTIRVACE